MQIGSGLLAGAELDEARECLRFTTPSAAAQAGASLPAAGIPQLSSAIEGVATVAARLHAASDAVRLGRVYATRAGRDMQRDGKRASGDVPMRGMGGVEGGGLDESEALMGGSFGGGYAGGRGGYVGDDPLLSSGGGAYGGMAGALREQADIAAALAASLRDVRGGARAASDSKFNEL